MTNADRELAKEELRKGGPSDTPGMITTTGGVSGPAMRPRRKNKGKKGPTTTGDAGSGAMNTPISGTTSSNSTGG